MNYQAMNCASSVGSNSIKAALFGASGRVGAILVNKLLSCNKKFQLVKAFVSPSSKLSDSPINQGELKYLPLTLESDLSGVDLAIDFSTPAGTKTALFLAVKYRVPLLIATTGLDEDLKNEIQKAKDKIPLLLAPNTSRVVAATRAAALAAAKILDCDYDVELYEIHHRHKKDLPSGTALSLAETLSKNLDLKIETRSQNNPRRSEKQLGVAALRGGETAGEHTIFFLGSSDRLEIKQQAYSREVYADGALWLAEKLLAKEVGVYCVEDLI
jgi:4-hydroxy-tetrahydrodipicolinate reductase